MKWNVMCRVCTSSILITAQTAAPNAPSPPASAPANGWSTSQPNVVEFFVEKPDEYETGPLHLIYSDGREVVEVLPAKKEPASDDSEDQVGYSSVQIAGDGRTVGWSETYFKCCQSYPIPLVLALYRSGSVLRRIKQGQMLWDWSFRDAGTQVATVWGLTHGPEVGDFQLYDVATRRMVAEVFGDEASQQLKSDAPNWAQDLQAELDRPARALERVVFPPADALER